MDHCVFCKIVAGEIPCAKVFENDTIFAFLDAFPDTQGHTLIVPKNHVETIFDIDKQLLGEITGVAQDIAKKLKDILGASGINLANNNGKHANQIVPHFHLHVIPRYENDGLQMYGARLKNQPSAEALQEVAEKLNS